MSVGDTATFTPSKRPCSLKGTSKGVAALKPQSKPSTWSSEQPQRQEKKLPDGLAPRAMEPLRLAERKICSERGIHRENPKQSRPQLSPRTSGSIQHLGEQIDRDSARCELERLLKTAGTQDKKKKIISALDRLEGSCRGTALTVIVNEALAVASATVAGAPRREIIAGHEHASNGKDELNGFETLDGNCGMSSSSGPPETNPRAIPRGSTQSSVGQEYGILPVEGRLDSARCFTIPLLPSIPEHHVPVRRVHVKQASSKSEMEDKLTKRRTCRMGDSDDEGKHSVEKGGESAGGRDLLELDSLVRRTQVADIPQALFGEASSTGVDPLHPPCAAANGLLASFWLSTGLFPQTLTIRLQRPVEVYEVTVLCGGVNAARVQLDSINNTGSVSGRGARKLQDRRPKSILELVGEPRRSCAIGGDVFGVESSKPSVSLVSMIFRVPGGEQSGRADRLSLVVMSSIAPFCIVTSIAIRGQVGECRRGEEGRDEVEF